MIFGIFGDIGSGKSWRQMYEGLRLANRFQKKLVTNFAVNTSALKKYAAQHKLWWVVWLCDNHQIAVIDAANELGELFDCKNSVVLLDEAGIFLNSRDFAKTPKKLLMDLAQSRKDGNDLLYAAQFDSQVDKQMRLLTQWFTHCQGVAKTDRKTKRPHLYWKFYANFKGAQYNRWIADNKAQTSFLRTWFMANHVEYGPFTKADASLFGVFDSFTRLEKQSASKSRHAESIPEIKEQTSGYVLALHQRSVKHRKRIAAYHRLWNEDKLLFGNLKLSEVMEYLRYKDKYDLAKYG